jgi:hypothetical protein
MPRLSGEILPAIKMKILKKKIPQVSELIAFCPHGAV